MYRFIYSIRKLDLYSQWSEKSYETLEIINFNALLPAMSTKIVHLGIFQLKLTSDNFKENPKKTSKQNKKQSKSTTEQILVINK